MKRLQIERERRGLSQAALARRAEIDQAHYSRIERGLAVPYPVQMSRIAVALPFDGTPADLMEDVTDLDA